MPYLVFESFFWFGLTPFLELSYRVLIFFCHPNIIAVLSCSNSATKNPFIKHFVRHREQQSEQEKRESKVTHTDSAMGLRAAILRFEVRMRESKGTEIIQDLKPAISGCLV